MQISRTGGSPVQDEGTFSWSYLPGSDLKSSLAYPNGLTSSWQYDANSQLLQVCNATPTNVISQYDTISFAYHYDDIGNRESSSERGSNSVYTANSLNQYAAVDGFSPQFDDDGNQTLVKTATGIWSVTYNGENRPVLWTLVNSSTPNSTTPLRKQVLRRLFSRPYPRASRTRKAELENSTHARGTRAGTICEIMVK